MDLEEEVADEKKTSETLKKEYDALVKKAKIIDGALKTAEADLEAFQVLITEEFKHTDKLSSVIIRMVQLTSWIED